MYFDPKTNKYPYPEDTAEHYLKINMDRGIIFDDKYPYIDNNKSFKFKRFFVRVLLAIIVFPMSYIRLGLRVKNKKVLKRNKKLISEGVISVSNHVHLWDYICIMNAVKFHHPHVLVWAPNVNGESGPLVRLVGGIPVPEKNVEASLKFMKETEDLINSGGWLQVYSEGSMWEYYAPIRPFKNGAAHFAVKCDKPIIPMAFSYRRPNWIRRKIFRQIACFTLTIGEPLFRNKELDKASQERDLTIRCHEAVCLLSGVNPINNIYPPIYSNSKRIDYYTNKYGVKK